jgi:hypothetical protein
MMVLLNLLHHHDFFYLLYFLHLLDLGVMAMTSFHVGGQAADHEGQAQQA